MIKKMKKLKKILLQGREALDTGAERWGETMTWGPMTDAQQRRADRIAATARIAAANRDVWRDKARARMTDAQQQRRAAMGRVADLRAAMAEAAALHCAVFAANTEVSVMRDRATRAEEDAASLRSELQASHEQLERARRTITDLARRADVLAVERDKAILAGGLAAGRQAIERNRVAKAEAEVLSLRAELRAERAAGQMVVRPYRDVCGDNHTTPTAAALSGGSHGRGPLYKSPSAGPVWTHRRHND